MLRQIALVVFALLLSGCTNNFITHFVGTPGADLPSGHTVVVLPKGEEVPPANFLGSSNFVSNGESSRDAQLAARELGADLVAWEQEYLHSTTSIGTREVISNRQITTVNNGTAITVGSDGVEQTHFSGTTTTYATETDHVPYTFIEHWYQVSADFYRLQVQRR